MTERIGFDRTCLKRPREAVKSFGKLPDGLIIRIFKSLSRETLLTVTFVSRRFRIQARQAFMERVASRYYLTDEATRYWKLGRMMEYTTRIDGIENYVLEHQSILRRSDYDRYVCWMSVETALFCLTLPNPYRDCDAFSQEGVYTNPIARGLTERIDHLYLLLDNPTNRANPPQELVEKLKCALHQACRLNFPGIMYRLFACGAQFHMTLLDAAVFNNAKKTTAALLDFVTHPSAPFIRVCCQAMQMNHIDRQIQEMLLNKYLTLIFQ